MPTPQRNPFDALFLRLLENKLSDREIQYLDEQFAVDSAEMFGPAEGMDHKLWEELAYLEKNAPPFFFASAKPLGRLDDIARRRLGGIMGILPKPGDFLFQFLNAFEKHLNLLSQSGNNPVFFIHASMCTRMHAKAQVLFINNIEFL